MLPLRKLELADIFQLLNGDEKLSQLSRLAESFPIKGNSVFLKMVVQMIQSTCVFNNKFNS